MWTLRIQYSSCAIRLECRKWEVLSNAATFVARHASPSVHGFLRTGGEFFKSNPPIGLRRLLGPCYKSPHAGSATNRRRGALSRRRGAKRSQGLQSNRPLDLGARPSSGDQISGSLIQPWTMSKHFRPWNIDQTLLLAPSVQDFVPKDHVSRFIVELVREGLGLKEIMRSYASGVGQAVGKLKRFNDDAAFQAEVNAQSGVAIDPFTARDQIGSINQAVSDQNLADIQPVGIMTSQHIAS
jgi:hypothetical protein